jgi:adenine-specific DNA-methyltransferase
MRYLGSKALVAEQLLDLISPRAGASFCDPFGGVATVSAVAKRRGCEVVTGDILTCPHNFQVARIASTRRPGFRGLGELYGLRGHAEVVAHLREQRAEAGWLISEFAAKRRFFRMDNAAMIEGARRTIAKWSAADALSEAERAILLASLVNSMDRVANTAGTYYAHLKHYSRKSLGTFAFDLLAPVPGARHCEARLCPADQIVGARAWDIVYLDPPYNQRCYAGYYHLPESISRLETPECGGLSGAPVGAGRPRSEFTRPAKALDALEALLSATHAKTVVFHYSPAGLIPLERARESLAAIGSISERVLVAPGYTTRQEPRRTRHVVLIASVG